MGLTIGKVLSFLRLEANGAKVSDVKLDEGGGDNRTARHFAPAGDDSFPLVTDYTVQGNTPGEGSKAVLGYADPINTPKALEGDKLIIGRDPATGLEVVEVWLKSDGTALVSNDNGSVTLRPDGGSVVTTPLSIFEADAAGAIAGTNGSGSFELEAAGDFLVNGVKIDTAGNITTPTTIVATGLISSAVSVAAPAMLAATSLTVAGKEMAGHTHPQGPDSAGNTQVNTGGPV